MSNKIPYTNLNIKTNRNQLSKLTGAGVHVPKNINYNSVKTSSLTLPDVVYHATTGPIESFNANKIFYVSYDPFQSIAHGISLLKNSYNRDPTLYLYALKPKKKNVKAVLFNRNYRPKALSNRLGFLYNSIKPEKAFIYGFSKKATANNIEKKEFKEGSGDNMIFGQFLCKSTNINGIRNTINQDEFAVCNPKDMFDIKKVYIKPFRNLSDIRHDIKFERNNTGYKYKLQDGSLYTQRDIINHVIS